MGVICSEPAEFCALCGWSARARAKDALGLSRRCDAAVAPRGSSIPGIPVARYVGFPPTTTKTRLIQTQAHFHAPRANGPVGCVAEWLANSLIVSPSGSPVTVQQPFTMSGIVHGMGAMNKNTLTSPAGVLSFPHLSGVSLWKLGALDGRTQRMFSAFQDAVTSVP